MTEFHPKPDCGWSTLQEGTLHCGLAEQITGLRQPVEAEVCRSCQAWFPPTAGHWTPAVASLVYRSCREIEKGGGSGRVNAEEAGVLWRRALSFIPEEAESISTAAEVQAQINLDLPDIADWIPRPKPRFGPAVREWGVGVTTAPRPRPTLARTLQGLHRAGWTDVRLFADGEVEIPDAWRHLEVSWRSPRMGAWPSYYLALAELLMRRPSADAFMIVQDDTVLFEHPQLRSYVESILWPAPERGIVSLYCSKAYARPVPGWHRLDERLIWGGQILIFDRETLIELVSDPGVIRHRLDPTGLANIDGVIGQWAEATGTGVYVPSPSLAQHIGQTSSIWENSLILMNRRAIAFAGTTRRDEVPLPT